MNKVRIENGTAFIILTKGHEAVIDVCDLTLVKNIKWYKFESHRSIYACSRTLSEGKYKTLYMHRLVMSNPVGFEVDHIDGNGLNNRRENLRLTTRSQNAKNMKKHIDNSSGFKGVSWNNEKKKWKAQISIKGKNTHLGYFENPEDAYKVYCQASHKEHGQYGRTF